MTIQKLCLFFYGVILTLSLPATSASNVMGESASIKLIDHEMIDTEKRTVKLVSDIMQDHIVVMNFIYTDCTTVCPVSTHIMKSVYQNVRNHPNLKKEVRLITLTLNPNIDTPRKMHEFSKKYGDDTNNWFWLTGRSTQVNEALLGLRAYAADVTEHASIILVGDPQKNHWTSFYQFPHVNKIVQRINEYVKTKNSS
jgi:protein SCO1/2